MVSQGKPTCTAKCKTLYRVLCIHLFLVQLQSYGADNLSATKESWISLLDAQGPCFFLQEEYI